MTVTIGRLRRCALLDYNGDGRLDLFLVNGVFLEGRPKEEQPRHALYRNDGGGRFTDVTAAAGVGGPAYGMGCAVGDYDGDRRADIAVFRPSNGVWWIIPSSTGQSYAVGWGGSGDVPVVGDYDGDGKADIAVFRPFNGVWWIVPSSTWRVYTVGWGGPGDIPVVGDYDGDGRADLAVFRPSNGVWYWIDSSDDSFHGEQFGIDTDTLSPADFDGDGRSDQRDRRAGGAAGDRPRAGFARVAGRGSLERKGHPRGWPFVLVVGGG